MSQNDPSWPNEGGDTPSGGSGGTPPPGGSGGTPPPSGGGGTPPPTGGGGTTPPTGGGTPPPTGGGTPPPTGGGTPPPTGGGGTTPPPGGGTSAAGAGKMGPGGRPLASFGERAIAFLIDFAIFIAVAIVVQIISFVLGSISDALALLFSLVSFVIYIGLGFVIFAMGEGGPLGQTPGKHMRGIQVLKEDGSQLEMGGGVIRWLGRILDTIICGLPIGYLWPLFDDQERTWHDMVASTRVVTGGPQGSVGEWFAKFRG